MNDPNFPSNLAIAPSRRMEKSSKSEYPHYLDQESSIRDFGIAGRVWESAYILDDYIHSSDGVEYDPPCSILDRTSGSRLIIELGSGTGVTAHALSKLLDVDEGDVLVATDLDSVCPLLLKNLLDCVFPNGPVAVRPLCWGNKTQADSMLAEFIADGRGRARSAHIFCSDLVYFPELLAPLLGTLLHLTSAISELTGGVPSVTISYKIRSLPKETPFWAAFGVWFDFQPVFRRVRRVGSAGEKAVADVWSRLGATDWDGDMFVFVATRRLGSLSWDIPDDDTFLMTGAGRGTDDTFERLLLMSIGNEDGTL